MPDAIDLTEVRAARADLADRRAALAAAQAETARIATERERLIAIGAAAGRVANADDRLARLAAERAGLERGVIVGAEAIDAAAGALRAGTFAEHAVTSMDGRMPVVMFPVRIETRYSADATTLRIRIFPDDVHIDSHVRELTEAEIELGEWYWARRWERPDDRVHADAAWAGLVERMRPARARYVAQLLRPREPVGDRSGPTFPVLAPRPPGPGRPPVAVALPERWAAIGFRSVGVAGQMTEVFRVWSERVPDDLAVAPDMNIGASTEEGDDGLEWMRDPAIGGSMGLLVEVTDADMPTGLRLGDGIERLVVVGADWTRSPDEAAAEIDRLFSAHLDTGRLGFMQFGAPTNHTGNAGEQPVEPEIVFDAEPVDRTEQSNASRITDALGVSGSALSRAPGADAQEHRWASALVDAIWEATAGFFLGEMMDPLVPDEHVETLRAHAAQHLHPSGPLPVLRIGRQPYGVLPVVAPDRLELDGDATLGGLSRTIGAVRRAVAPGVRSVPRLDAASGRDDLADVLVELLQRTPVAWAVRARTLHDPVSRFITVQDWASRVAMQQQVRDVVLGTLGALHRPRLDELAIDPRTRPVTLPFVRKGDAGTSYLAEIAAAVRADNADQRLRMRQSSVTLLEALLAFAGAQELERAGTDTIHRHLFERNVGGQHDLALRTLAKRGVRTPALLRVEDRASDRQANPIVDRFASGRDLSSRVIPEITGTATVQQAVARRLAEVIDAGRLPEIIQTAGDPHRQLARFAAALDVLADAPLDELEWAFRGVLDCFASRVDAWATSLASRRLADHRAAAPAGAHIGCFGWVEHLRPDVTGLPESLGYVHSPSVAHATATAILRAGRHASDDETFDLEITSRRVRNAERLLDGLSSGQSLASVLGFRIERALRDSVTLGRYILPLRGLASLAGPPEGSQNAAPGSAGDVVDGLAVLERWRADPNAVLEAVDTEQAHRARLSAALDEVDGVFDSLSDALVAESIFQISNGNIERGAGAAMRSHDRPQQPTRLEFVRTPPSGSTITHRVIVATSDTSAPGWPIDMRHRAEPRFDAWLGRMIGPADEIGLEAVVRRDGGATGTPVTITLSELGLGPLSTVLAFQRVGEQQASELEQLIARRVAARSGAEEGDVIVGGETLDRLRTLCSWGHELLRCQALTPSDLLPGDVTGRAIVDVDELAQRVETVRAELDTVHRRIADVVRRADSGAAVPTTTLAARLARAAVFEPALATPTSTPEHPEAGSLMAAQLDPVERALAARSSRTQALVEQLTDATSDDQRVALHVAALRELLGPAQPVLPVFRLVDTSHLDGGITRREELLAGDETAPLAWIHKLALVRPGLDPLAGLLLHSEIDRGDITADIGVTQWPLQGAPRWYALPNGPDGPPPDGATCIAGHFPDTALDRRLAGVVVDSWTESIPSAEAVTGLSFHYDAPGARAPQSILLAVHPSRDPDGWDFDTLVDTVSEAIELTHLRGAGPRELGVLSGLLPALFVPELPTREVPTLPIKQMAERFAAATGMVASDVLGKD